MPMSTEPGLPRQGAIRRNARIFGIIVTVLGAAVVIAGLVVFVQAFSNDYDPFEDEGIPRPVFGLVALFGGGVLLVIGRSLLTAGYGGVALRYAAGEAAPTIKDTLAHLKDDGSTVTGPFCSKCGVRNDQGAQFCDACGTALTSSS